MEFQNAIDVLLLIEIDSNEYFCLVICEASIRGKSYVIIYNSYVEN
jgi:hypothetical protein